MSDAGFISVNANLAIEKWRGALFAVDDLYRHNDLRSSGALNSIGIELRRKLVQCLWLLQRCAKLEVDMHRLTEECVPPPLPAAAIEGDPAYRHWQQQVDDWQRDASSGRFAPVAMQLHEATEEIELLTESFYYFAFRGRSVMKLLPGCHKFEAPGVRDVRNHLIEHPESRASGVVYRGFASGGTQGAVLRAVRHDTDPQVFQDRGLWLNAQEYADLMHEKAVHLLSPTPDEP